MVEPNGNSMAHRHQPHITSLARVYYTISFDISIIQFRVLHCRASTSFERIKNKPQFCDYPPLYGRMRRCFVLESEFVGTLTALFNAPFKRNNSTFNKHAGENANNANYNRIYGKEERIICTCCTGNYWTIGPNRRCHLLLARNALKTITQERA